MKITDVETIILRQPTVELIGDGSQDTLVVIVHTDEGIDGIGEVDSAPRVVKAIIDMPASHMACMGLKEAIVGEDAFDIEKIWRKMYEKALYHGRRGAVIHAMSGIDIALWDAVGKKLGLPVCKLLGGAFRTEIPAYCSVLMPETKDGIKALAEKHMPKGYRGMKLGWGALGRDFATDLRLAGWAREALGPDAELMLDIGMLWTDVKGAIQTVRAMEQFNVQWVEEPFGPDQVDAYRRLADSTGARISGGEELGTMFEFEDLIDRGHIDVVQPDLSRCGGFTVARQLRDYATARNVTVVPHAFKTNILMAATLQYIASLPKAWLLEFCEQDTVLRQTLTRPVFSIRGDGMADIPQKPGIGVELDMEIVEKYRER
jgi:L-alanine-DL-glutamate epimerase-like enolase superfamily enzyme